MSEGRAVIGAGRVRRAARCRPSRIVAIVPALLLGGCAGAPSFVLFGAYFPAWMLCAGIGLLVAIAARVGLVASGLAQALPAQLFLCVAIGVLAAAVAWLVWFGR